MTPERPKDKRSVTSKENGKLGGRPTRAEVFEQLADFKNISPEERKTFIHFCNCPYRKEVETFEGWLAELREYKEEQKLLNKREKKHKFPRVTMPYTKTNSNNLLNNLKTPKITYQKPTK